MAKIKLFVLFILIIVSCTDKEKKGNSEELIDSIAIQYGSLFIEYPSFLVDKIHKEKVFEILNKVEILENSKDYPNDKKYLLSALKFKCKYILGEKSEAIEEINQIEENENYQIFIALYRGVFYYLEEKNVEAMEHFRISFKQMDELDIDESNCSNYNILAILSKEDDKIINECNEHILPQNYFNKLSKIDKRQLIYDVFFNSIEL